MLGKLKSIELLRADYLHCLDLSLLQICLHTSKREEEVVGIWCEVFKISN
jgi:hypothetical protein